ncbi:MAG: hypothetical protein NUW24_13660 [Anaerolineae bacterium]|nr:hypothetical protein [Anaerolineae bacterium]MDH7475494.1 hypothetical protein [Anaerolineae bacterium]
MVTSLGCGIGYYVSENPYPAENRIDDVLGEIEPIVLAEREPLTAEISPDGQWLIAVMEHEQRFREWIAIDLVHNVEHVLATRDGGSSGLVWLDNQHAVMTMGGGLSMLRVPDLNRWHLTDLRSPSSAPVTDLGILWKADYLYVVEGEFSSGYAVFSVDEDLPYYVSMSTVWRTQEDVETALAGIPHTIIQAGRSFDPDARYYSPDGRYYVTDRPFGEPGTLMTYNQEAMFDAATEKEVAHAYKYYWSTYFLGWAYDSSGAYFMFQPRGVDADVLHPRHPIYKLLVPGATPRGTPVPASTPTPSGESRAPGSGYIGRSADGRKAETRGGVGMLAAVLPLLATPALAVVWYRRKESRRGWVWVALTLAVGTGLGCGIGYNVPANPYPGENRLDDVLGEVEPIVLAEREPMAASLSPDGKWMLVLIRETGPVLAIDLEHNQEYEILSDGGTTARWLDDNHAFLRRGIILRVPDIEMWQVERLSFPDPAPTDIDVLRDAKFVYVLVGWPSSVPVLVTADPSVPYEVAVNWSVEEVEAHLAGIPHTIIQAGGLLFDYNSRHYSPDGQYYVAPRPVNVPGDSLDYPLIAMFDAATEKEVAHAFKWGWHGDFRGWAYDNSGAYFIYKPWGVDADVLHPRHPIYKLLVPGATPRGTPVPVSTPTPSSEGRVPGTGQLQPVAYRPAPVAQSGEQGWYVDDVSVFDAASSPYIFYDDFDRPDSSDLGPAWVEEAGNWNITSGQLHCPVTQSGCRVATTESFGDTAFVIETRLRATGNFITPWKLKWFEGDTGYYVWYWPYYLFQPPPPIPTGKEDAQPLSPGPRAATLSLVRMSGGQFEVLDQTGVPSWVQDPTAWRTLKVVREASTGLIEVYADEGSGYPDTPLLQATDSTFPQLRRLGWWAGGGPGHFYVDWVTVTPGGAP